MKKYLLILVAFILTAAVVTATVLNTKPPAAKAKKECPVKKTECSSEKKKSGCFLSSLFSCS